MKLELQLEIALVYRPTPALQVNVTLAIVEDEPKGLVCSAQGPNLTREVDVHRW